MSDKTRWFYFITLSVPLYSQTRYADLEQKRAALHKAELEAQDAKLKAICAPQLRDRYVASRHIQDQGRTG
ncbi:MAG: hypothetical protein JRJ87_21875 [Deltaproteobacteria bacterium]|nr:hypothetical protein [Deltaproteobacteria bacterium]